MHDFIAVSLRMTDSVVWYQWTYENDGRRIVAFSRSPSSPLNLSGGVCERVAR